MAELAKKFVDRAPRYVIRASDNKFLKFAPDGDYQHIFTTRLVNISISGLAFITTVDQAPKKGDLIKMEFPIPGGEQIAWWGKVVRIENYSAKKSWQPQSEDFYDKKEILVAVKFESLPDGHMQRIRSGLLAKAQELARQKKFQLKGQWLDFLKANWYQISVFALCIIFTLSFLYIISRPSGNYSADRGAPWGQRFK